ncbi:hypothetical protein LJB42_004218 [Komagataella kurtzmanii]|nr:hypothetical protein LJB42_004218 [Komagataella kurtzmanii]
MSIPQEAPKSPGWRPVIFLNIEADEPKSIYVNNTGSLTGVNITGGFAKSIDPEYPFDAIIDSGYDDIRADPGASTSRLDCRVYLTTSEGAGVFLTYPGVVRMEKTVVDVLTQKSSFMDFNDGYVTCTPVVHLDEKVKKEQWITKETIFGKGRFVRDNEGRLRVQYYLYVLA